MRIGISTFGCDRGQSGIGRYLASLLDGFEAQAAGAELRLIGGEDDLAAFAGDGRTSLPPPSGRWCGTLGNVLWNQTGLPLAARRHGLDVLFLPAANRRLPLWSPCPTVGTVHDLSVLRVEGKYSRAHTLYIRHVLPALIRGLTRIITISQSSLRDIVELAGVPPSRVAVVPCGVDTQTLRPMPAQEARRALGDLIPDDRPYLLYVSRIEHPAKNHVRLIEAFARLRATAGIPHRLVLAGPRRERADEVERAADRSGARHDIVFSGFLPERLLPPLYAAADAFVFPSLYEGFGLPVLEAMACGTAVACADVSSLPEVAGEAALYFDPRDVDDITRALGRIVGDGGLRAALVEAGHAQSRRFSWHECARRMLEIFDDVAERRHRPPAVPQETASSTRNARPQCPSSASRPPATPPPGQTS